MPQENEWFIVKLVSCRPGIALDDLWTRYRKHYALPYDQAAGDLLRLVESGLITASMHVTEAGTAYLAGRQREEVETP